MKNMQHQGNTKRTDKALKILQEICKENKKYEKKNEDVMDLGYAKVNDESDPEEEVIKKVQPVSRLPTLGNKAKNMSNLNSRNASIDMDRLPPMDKKQLQTIDQTELEGKKVAVTLPLQPDENGDVTKHSKPILYRQNSIKQLVSNDTRRYVSI